MRLSKLCAIDWSIRPTLKIDGPLFWDYEGFPETTKRYSTPDANGAQMVDCGGRGFGISDGYT